MAKTTKVMEGLEKMYRLKTTLKKFWCLEGFVAIIFSIFTISALLHGSILGAILMGIFSYWWLKRVLARTGGRSRGYSKYNGRNTRDLDL